METLKLKTYLFNKESLIQYLLWGLYFATINVKWTQNWIAKSFLPESVAPHIALAVPIIFILNTFWLIPKFLNKRNWRYYIKITFTILVGFEVLRAFIFAFVLQYNTIFFDGFTNELLGENSLVFGVLNIMIFNVILFSFLYRFTKDWFVNQTVIEKLGSSILTPKVGIALPNGNLYTDNFIFDITNYKTTFSIKKRDKVFILKVEDISYFQAQGDFVLAIDKNGKKHIVNDTLTNIENSLNPKSFFRINRSEIVNNTCIIEYNSYIKNRLAILLSNPITTLYTSNSRTPEFRKWIVR